MRDDGRRNTEVRARCTHRELSDEPREPIHVSVPRETGMLGVAGVLVHYSSRLPRARHPVRLPPQTRLEDTVLDLAELARTAEDAVAWPIKACQRRLTTPDRISSAVEERRRVRWRSDVRDAVAVTGAGVHSPLELRYFRDVEYKHGLVPGDRQVLVTRGTARQYLDVRYSDYGVVVELELASSCGGGPGRVRLRPGRRLRSGPARWRPRWAGETKPRDRSILLSSPARAGCARRTFPRSGRRW